MADLNLHTPSSVRVTVLQSDECLSFQLGKINKTLPNVADQLCWGTYAAELICFIGQDIYYPLSCHPIGMSCQAGKCQLSLLRETHPEISRGKPGSRSQGFRGPTLPGNSKGVQDWAPLAPRAPAHTHTP